MASRSVPNTSVLSPPRLPIRPQLRTTAVSPNKVGWIASIY